MPAKAVALPCRDAIGLISRLLTTLLHDETAVLQLCCAITSRRSNSFALTHGTVIMSLAHHAATSLHDGLVA